MTLKITPADKWFSYCVRERSDWTCEFIDCGIRYEPPTKALHCAHYYSRGKWATRLEPLGAMAMCYGHHRLIDRDRELKKRIYVEIFGPYALDILDEKLEDLALAKSVFRTKGRGLIAAHFKAEYERMMNERAAGVVGRLEFIGYE
jgi:hypothetical protein